QPELWAELGGTANMASLVVSAVLSCTPDIREDLLQDIVLVGGTARLPGIVERMERELLIAAPDHLCGAVHVRTLADESMRTR
ncbi:unnamed protein product, partial [Discosporangium mesarthrocarpum]